MWKLGDLNFIGCIFTLLHLPFSWEKKNWCFNNFSTTAVEFWSGLPIFLTNFTGLVCFRIPTSNREESNIGSFEGCPSTGCGISWEHLLHRSPRLVRSCRCLTTRMRSPIGGTLFSFPKPSLVVVGEFRFCRSLNHLYVLRRKGVVLVELALRFV